MTTQQSETIELVKKITEAMVVVAETTKSNKEISESIRDAIVDNNTVAVANAKEIATKMDGLMTMFKWVIVPLVAGILALVGVKMVANL